MTVSLNGNPFDVVMENERTVGELLMGLEIWLEERSFSVSSLNIDGLEIPAREIELASQRSLDSVDRIDLRASSLQDLKLKALRESSAWLSATGTVSGYQSNSSIKFLTNLDEGIGVRLEAILSDPTRAEPARIQAALGFIAEREHEFDDSVGVFIAASTGLSAMADRLEALPLQLQTGKDAHAAETLRDFSDLTGTLLRLLPLVERGGINLVAFRIGENNIKEYFDELGSALKELVSAFETGDAILVGDLSEYEIAPRLRALETAIATFPFRA
jgi:hypothetical protein